MADFPPLTPQSLQKAIPAYLYEQYTDDDDLQGFFEALNELTQLFVDWFNQTQLPYWPGLYSDLLDWVALGLYGTPRPTLAFDRSRVIGTLATYVFASQPTLAAGFRIGGSDLYVVSDDVFKRVLTWNFYKGDGWTFTINWFKRRIVRFLSGTNGIPFNIDQTYSISITQPSPAHFLVVIFTGDPGIAEIMRAGIYQRVLHLPFQYELNIQINVIVPVGSPAWWNYTLPIDFATRSFAGQFMGTFQPL